jgi:NAD(P)-dependent dehydrogenase (short-subunit alcohol dehydrogenase family)
MPPTPKDDAEAVASEVRALGCRSIVVAADLTDEAAVRALVPAATAALGPLSVLVNNASVFEDDRVGALSRETWDRHIETNLRSPIVLAEAFAAQAPDGSAIVNLLDQRVLKPDPRFVSYAISRNGLWWATRTLAQALAKARGACSGCPAALRPASTASTVPLNSRPPRRR